MPRLHLTDRPDYNGQLALALHPDGYLKFADGVAQVDSADLAADLTDRYGNVAILEAEDADAESAETEAETAGLDPSNFTIAELEDAVSRGEITVDTAEAVLARERAGPNRVGAKELLRDVAEVSIDAED